MSVSLLANAVIDTMLNGVSSNYCYDDNGSLLATICPEQLGAVITSH